MVSTVTTKGQITIPKAVRERLNLRAGDAVEFRFQPEDCSVVVTRADGAQPKSRFESIIGTSDVGMTTDEIMALLRGEDDGL